MHHRICYTYIGMGLLLIVVALFFEIDHEDRPLVRKHYLLTLCKTNSKMKKVRLRLGNGLYCGGDKPVHVCAYVRIRFGRVEYVREHCRSFPNMRLAA